MFYMLATTTVLGLVLIAAAFHPSHCSTAAAPDSLANQAEDLLDTQDRIVGPNAFVADTHRLTALGNHPSVRHYKLDPFQPAMR